MAEQWKRIQNRNVLEERTLQAKIRLFAKEQSYIDKELQQILQAKESLLRSLRQANLHAGMNREKRPSEASQVKKQCSKTDDLIKNFTRPKSASCQRQPKTHDNKKKISHETIHVLPSKEEKKARKKEVYLPPEKEKSTAKESPIQRKSCFRGVSQHTKRTDSHVRFTQFPEIIDEKVKSTFVPSIDNDDKIFISRSKYINKSHADSLDEIQIKSKFFQIGSVALATAMFRSNQGRWSAIVPNTNAGLLLKESCVKPDANKDSLDKDRQKVPRSLRRVQSSRTVIRQPKEKLLNRRQSVRF